jgi:hypothetical protein
MDVSRLQDVCRRYSGCANEYYVGESIPQHKANNARVSLQIPGAEKIVALIDFTVFGSAKDAMVVTDGGIYWKGAMEDPHSLRWSQLQQKTMQETMQETSILTVKYIDFGEGLKMNLAGATELGKKDNHTVLKFLNELKELNNDEVSQNRNSGNAEERDGGLIQCEFCKNMIKPDVTYCKHCGIKLRG